jgi:hypothetical protein
VMALILVKPKFKMVSIKHQASHCFVTFIVAASCFDDIKIELYCHGRIQKGDKGVG